MSNGDEQYEKKMQEWLEKGGGEGAAGFDREDLEAYRKLFDALGKKPPTGLPYNFSAKVVAGLQERKERRREIRWYILVMIGLPLLGSGGLYLTAYYLQDSLSLAFISRLLSYKWLFAAGIAFFFIVEYLDIQLVRKKKLF